MLALKKYKTTKNKEKQVQTMEQTKNHSKKLKTRIFGTKKISTESMLLAMQKTTI